MSEDLVPYGADKPDGRYRQDELYFEFGHDWLEITESRPYISALSIPYCRLSLPGRPLSIRIPAEAVQQLADYLVLAGSVKTR